MFDVVIIGGGIAGQTAAIYAARKRMDYVVLAKELGGQFLQSGEILNYPGIVETSGVELSSRMREQLEFNHVEVNEGEEAEKIEHVGGNFRVVSDKGVYETKTVIIATGARPRKLGVPGEEKLRNKGVIYCSICDGPLFADMDVAIVGGGNAALEAVSFMERIAKKIYLLNKNKEFFAHEYLVERLPSYRNVEVILEADTKEILGEDFVSGLVYEKTGKRKKLDVGGVIVEIGRVPNTDFVSGFVDLDEDRHIKTDCQMNTSVPGVFAAGDCAGGHEYQYIIGAGQGCMALLKAVRYLAATR